MYFKSYQSRNETKNVIHSYLSDNITAEWKTIRFVILECSIQLGYPIGLLISAQILMRWGFTWVLLSALVLGTGMGLYTIFLLRNDTLKSKHEHERDLLSSPDDEPEPRKSLWGYVKVFSTSNENSTRHTRSTFCRDCL